MNEILETSQEVTWEVDGFKLKGVVIQDFENGNVKVLLFERDGRNCYAEVNVDKELLIKIN